MWDTLLLMALALVVFGPRRLPKIGRQLGKLMYEFRKASNDFKFQMEEELRASEEADRRKKEEEARQRTLAAAQPPAQLEATALQIPAATPGTQESGSSDLKESPYSEGTDPNIKAPIAFEAQTTKGPESTLSIETAPSVVQSTDPAPAAAVPHIQPPSTGEKIAADPPGKTQGNLFPEAEGSEPAAHHGGSAHG
jgi:sec-independent protein translocase protein TatB